MTAYHALSGRAALLRSDAVRSYTSSVLAWLLQRLPFLTHVGIVLLCAIGPIFTPHLLAFLLVFVHIVFVCCQSRTAYGIFACWRGTQAHARRDWSEYYVTEKIKLEAAGRGHHVLAVTDVQHVIIVPAYKEDLATLREVSLAVTSVQASPR